MSRKNRNKQVKKEEPGLIKSLANLSLTEIDQIQKSIPLVLQSKLQQMSGSQDLDELIKANLYIDNLNKRQDGHVKAVFFNPSEVSNSGRGYKDANYFGSLSFETLR